MPPDYTDERTNRLFKKLFEVLDHLDDTNDPPWLIKKDPDQFVVDLQQIDKWLAAVTHLQLLAEADGPQYFVDLTYTTLKAIEVARDVQERTGSISSSDLIRFRRQIAGARLMAKGFDPAREARTDASIGRRWEGRAHSGHDLRPDSVDSNPDSAGDNEADSAVRLRIESWDAASKQLSVKEVAVRPAAETPADPNETSPRRERNGRHYRVWFGTDRGRAVGEGTSFGVNWSEKLTLGSCDVYVPTTHKFASIGSSWIVRKVKGLFGIEDDRLRLGATRILSARKFGESVGRELKKSKSTRTALIYVHGYNVSFEEAAIRAAQIGVDLRVEGITAFFSWPSKGALIPYASDEANIDLAEKHFVAFLERLSQSANLQEINILAHSMGNRLLCRTIDRLVIARRSGALRVPIGHIVLAAADLTAEFFSQYAHQYKQLATRRVTNYACGRDLALWGSQLVHGIARVGFTPPIFTHKDLDTISVSGFNLDLLGHGYFASAEALLYDISSLIRAHMEPARRQKLVAVPRGAPRYWVLQM